MIAAPLSRVAPTDKATQFDASDAGPPELRPLSLFPEEGYTAAEISSRERETRSIVSVRASLISTDVDGCCRVRRKANSAVISAVI